MNQIRYTSRPIAVEFFAGAGGLSLGLEQAGFDVVLAVDRDGYHVATHERNFPYGLSICASVTDLNGDKLRELLGTSREIDLVAGGPPCQGFSHMGTRDLLDPRNTLVNEFVRLVLELRPKAFLMENVPGMQSGATAAIFEHALTRWQNEEPGYVSTTPVRTLNAANFGVPQSRERLFVLGIRRDIASKAQYPDGPLAEQPARPTVQEAIADLPRLAEHPEMLETDSTTYDESRPRSAYARVLRGLEQDPTDFSHPRAWDRSKASCSAAVRHRPEIAALYAATIPGTMVPGHKLPKLHPNGLAPTLRAGSESEHGSYTAPRPVHPEEPRCITAREAARLHGYPDWFRFYPGKWHAYRQIGNSVCPPVARALGRQIMLALGHTATRPAQALQLSTDFALPEARPRQHRRITQLSEWPKILEHLLRRARNDRGHLVRPDFSVRDVENAYEATGANMPRNPARRFLADLARSRNVAKLLSPVTQAGLTIIQVGENGTYGRFVPKGTADGIDVKDGLHISSKEIPDATSIRAKVSGPLTGRDLLRLVTRGRVARRLFGDATRIHLEGARDLLGEFEPDGLRFRAVQNERCVSKGALLVVQGRNLPPLSQLGTHFTRTGVNALIVLAPLTQRHFAAFLVTARENRLRVRRKSVFHVVIEDGAEAEAAVAPSSVSAVTHVKRGLGA
jgi:DNA (cytosine-5)-methyltransferase 1